ncbi:MAG: lipoyl(octanoyl) transferase LipB [Candidatus Omnitrophica bacterium]|nr:lipoyl(octanoyl) transferase LipB [Candidatus Omnitrophota bacterium]
MTKRKLKVIDLGVIEFEKSYRFQREILKNRQYNETIDTLILQEYFPCYTIGREGLIEEILFDDEAEEYNEPVDVYEVDRGGAVFYHGPGQLIAYLISPLSPQDICVYVKNLEEVCIRLLRKLGLAAYRKKNRVGVWIGKKQIGFFGIGISQWISYHGMAINVNPDLSAFKMIDEFNDTTFSVGSMNDFLEAPLHIKKAKVLLTRSFCEVYNYRVEKTEKFTRVA